MKTYSSEFDAGQAGFVRVTGDISADPTFDTSVGDPYDKLQGIDQLEGSINLVNQTTAVSVVFLMKSISVSVNVSGYPILELIDESPAPDPVKDAAGLVFGREATEDATFWEALQTLDAQDDSGGRQTQNFLLYVFYESLTDETRELFI